MSHHNILVTGGAGFVGSNLAVRLKQRDPSTRVTALDNLKRRGSELNLPRLRAAGIEFVHGDIRCPEDLVFTDDFDLILDCSAEPSVLAGLGVNPGYVIQTNLAGTVNLLELARTHRADFVFLSTSRVYPVAHLNALQLEERDTRFELAAEQPLPGASTRGISEEFSLVGYRSMYGATKLASELLVQEYAQAFALRTVVNRCGVLAGPWQMGKSDQGVFSLWVLAHHFRRPLSYIGFGGTGKQVRDVLHVDDLDRLLALQLSDLDRCAGCVFNVGGGPTSSLSLREATALCQELTGNEIPIPAVSDCRPADVPHYVTDNSAVQAATGWKPVSTARETLTEMHDWVRSHESDLAAILN